MRFRADRLGHLEQLGSRVSVVELDVVGLWLVQERDVDFALRHHAPLNRLVEQDAEGCQNGVSRPHRLAFELALEQRHVVRADLVQAAMPDVGDQMQPHASLDDLERARGSPLGLVVILEQSRNELRESRDLLPCRLGELDSGPSSRSFVTVPDQVAFPLLTPAQRRGPPADGSFLALPHSLSVRHLNDDVHFPDAFLALERADFDAHRLFSLQATAHHSA